ncbi:putative cell wall binding repeat 2-containing protein [Catenulispora acidiphila DSM 44928]|uniref:Putative cell wall binding repeat 2-containing protein n=1 Tax=Catenulispora acidiphila (strain DSM 44928 / JCM 14897 / NBRC 102108 / NRRL B-24433 / ID139908) TaxID=479433 RepID=C7QJ60_CATAD|nr:cell wall-binding repeat-containing protein [Catenulispora acidiphila]ACU69202.1 putative cell wall binding repeat 2-containing protein [Catenulispora acidiphila DSM 44928]
MKRRTSSLLTAIALVSGAAASTLAVAPAQAATDSGTCASGSEKQGPISFNPSAAVAPATIGIRVAANTIDAANGCKAVLDFGDGTSTALSTDADVAHTYTNPGDYRVTLTLQWPGYSPAVESGHLLIGGAAGQAQITRIAGADRLDTAVQISQKQWLTVDPKSSWGQAQTAVIATSGTFPDALAGGPLAAYKRGPLLLTPPNAGLYGAANDEINRVVPKGRTIFILGGYAAVSASVDQQLITEGYKVQRFAGQTRFDTALQVAKFGLGDPANVVVATGTDFPDALSAGPLAAGPRATEVAGQAPQPAAIILTNGAKFFDPSTSAYVKGKLGTANCNAVTAVGGAAVHALGALAGGLCHSELSGADRYATSAKVFGEFSLTYLVGVASGTTFADALTGAAYVANVQQPLLLTDPTHLPDPIGAYFDAMGKQAGISYVDVFGGPKAITDHVYGQIADAAHSGEYNP